MRNILCTLCAGRALIISIILINTECYNGFIRETFRIRIYLPGTTVKKLSSIYVLGLFRISDQNFI